MILPDVLNTMLMGLIFMVILVTVVRPLLLNVVGNPVFSDAEQQQMLDVVHQELARVAYEEETKRAHQIRYQQLLIELPPRLQPKPVVQAEPEPEEHADAAADSSVVDATAHGDGTTEAVADSVPAVDANGQPMASDAAQTNAAQAGSADAAAPEEALAAGEIEIREGETLAEIKERMKREQKNAKKPVIPPELLNNAKSYEDKVGVVRMVVHQDQSRVAAVIRGMIETK